MYAFREMSQLVGKMNTVKFRRGMQKAIASIFHGHKREIKNTFACWFFLWASAFPTRFFSCVFLLVLVFP